MHDNRGRDGGTGRYIYIEREREREQGDETKQPLSARHNVSSVRAGDRHGQWRGREDHAWRRHNPG